MEVFEYSIPGTYTIKASSKSIAYSWKKFQARIEAPESYCDYQCDGNGELRLYSHADNRLTIVDKERWGELWPVFFETNCYSFTIYFDNIEEGTEPHIIHPDKRVSEMFNPQSFGSKAFLNGTIDFLNNPGRFSLKFAYTPKGGREQTDEISFDVVSPKLDTKNDLNTIIQDIRAEYDDLVFRYLSLTYRQFARGREANNDVIWLAVFKDIIGGYVNSVRYIVHRPHHRGIERVDYRNAERIRKWNRHTEEKFEDDLHKDQEQALHKLYRQATIEDTQDTRENRFVKYTVERISDRLLSVLRKIKANSQDNLSTEEQEGLRNQMRELELLKRLNFFRSIGRFDGFRQESIVLQQRTGYAQVYRYWLMLQNGLNLIDGKTSVGVLPIWQLYEVWCFLKMKRLVCDILHLDPANADDAHYIHENKETMLNPFAGSDLSDSVVYENKENGDIIELGYQYSYSPRKRGEIDNVRSVTVEQRPDIVLNIKKKNEDIVLTYLFDAKYRVKIEGSNEEESIKDLPEEDTLNQMHRYRDALYYGDRQYNNFAKEVIGAYILFPGRLQEVALQHDIDQEKLDTLPYYLRSIYQVNIGAYPLLPNEESGVLLRNQLRKIIIGETSLAQLQTSVPQRGLEYHPKSNTDDETLVLVGFYNDYQTQWMFGESVGQYNIRLEGDLNKYLNIKYLLLYCKEDRLKTNRLFKIKEDTHVRVLSPEEMKTKGYESGHGYRGSYFYYNFRKQRVDDESLQGYWNPYEMKENNGYGRPFVISLRQLKERIRREDNIVADIFRQ